MIDIVSFHRCHGNHQGEDRPAGDGAAAAAKLRLAGPSSHEGCIDGTSLAAAFTSQSWCARLMKAAPAATLQQGRALLESFGLL